MYKCRNSYSILNIPDILQIFSIYLLTSFYKIVTENSLQGLQSKFCLLPALRAAANKPTVADIHWLDSQMDKSISSHTSLLPHTYPALGLSTKPLIVHILDVPTTFQDTLPGNIAA